MFSPNNTYGMDTTSNDLPASHEDIEYQASNIHNRVRRKASSNDKKRNKGKKSKGCKVSLLLIKNIIQNLHIYFKTLQNKLLSLIMQSPL